MNLLPVILAAGQGTRMRSALPKVLHPLAGKPLLQHVLDAFSAAGAQQMRVVYGHGGTQVREAIDSEQVTWVLQAEQKGTGHAAAQAIKGVADEDWVVVAAGDVPLIRAETVHRLAETLQQAHLCVLTTELPIPTGYGRIVRDQGGQVCAIVEEKDATPEQRQIHEVNTGFMAARGQDWKQWLAQLKPENAQGEYYLTDCLSLAVNAGQSVTTVLCADPVEVEGVNTRLQLARLERVAQQRQAEVLMAAGVTLADPARLDVRGTVRAQQDVFIDVNVVLEGQVELGEGVVIEANCVIKDAVIAAGCHIKAHSVIEGATLATDCIVGPFARLRPGTVLAEAAKIGNFVETKAVQIGRGSKVNHLSYVGDTLMGEQVNIGAGTITCNYDGAAKHQTRIGDRVFVGSGTQLVAPVTVQQGATIGAGSTITRTVPAESLAVARAKQMIIENWQRPVKEKK